MPWDIAQQFFRQQSELSGSRSTILTMLGWMAATLSTCMLGTIYFHAPTWMQVLVAAMFAADFVVFLGAYIFFAITDPEKLRSERFSIQKLAIEHHLFGDSATGVFQIDQKPAGGDQISDQSRGGNEAADG